MSLVEVMEPPGGDDDNEINKMDKALIKIGIDQSAKYQFISA